MVRSYVCQTESQSARSVRQQRSAVPEKKESQWSFRSKQKQREEKSKKRTVLVFHDSDTLAIQKRPDKGLLAGLYELPNLEGWLSQQEVIEYSKSIGLSPIRIKKLPAAKHIFSHVEWQMKGYEIQVDELEKNCSKEMIFAKEEVLKEKYSIPSAFEAYCVWKQK